MNVVEPKNYKLTHRTSREWLEEKASYNHASNEVVVSVYTCWWSLYAGSWMPYTIPGNQGRGIPCDPIGSALKQGSFWKFWTMAAANPEFYGEYGLDALVAAFHGNVVDRRHEKPAAFAGWDFYNELLRLEDH